jgi:3-deoxy-D-manno-octulosonate 8-phosphate phosphatase (KDO 8-P phosphatase)
VDIELMEKAGLSITVPNANYNKLTDYSDWVTPRPGGFGAVRDACDLIVLAKNDKKTNK